MCRASVAALGLALWSLPLSAKGQPARPGRERVLLARAESLTADIQRRDELDWQQRSRERRARVFRVGDLVLLLQGDMPMSVSQRIVSGADTYLADFGAIPRPFVASRVVVSAWATGVDSVLRAEGLLGRARVSVALQRPPDSLADDWTVASALGRAYWKTLGDEWRSWLPADLSVGWMTKRDAPAAVRDLMQGETRVGARCLEGDAAACRLWLGLDRDRRPFAARYEPSELRRMILNSWWSRGEGAALTEQCTNGSDAACVLFAETRPVFPPVPAGDSPRRSLVRSVRAGHGAEALRAAYADTAGSVGERLARAAGISEDSLVLEWRTWLLTGGGQERVTADVHDAVPALAVAVLLLLAAARSGRWR